MSSHRLLPNLKKGLSFLSLCFASANCFAQPFQGWIFDDAGHDDQGLTSARIVLDPSGYIHACNESESHATLIAPDGTLLWRKRLSGHVEFDRGVDVGFDSDCNTYVLTAPGRSVRGELSFRLSKLDLQGNILFNKIYSIAPSIDTLLMHPNSMVVSPSGTIYVGGAVRESLTSPSDAFVAAFSRNGSLLWCKTWEGSAHEDDEVVQLKLFPDGGVVAAVGANETDFNHDTGNELVLRYSPSGILLWTFARSNSFPQGPPGAIDISPDGFIAVGGDGELAIHYSALLLTPTGEQINFTSISDAIYTITSVAFAPDRSFYVAGARGHAEYLAKFSVGGSLLWSRTYSPNMSLDDGVIDMKVDNEGSAYLLARCGFLEGSQFKSKFAAIKYDSNGNLVWPMSGGNFLNGAVIMIPGEPTTLQVDNLGGFIVSGRQDATNDAWIARFSEQVVPFAIMLRPGMISTGTSTATACLTGPAPIGGLDLFLGANGSPVKLSAGVVHVPEGSLSATFSVANNYGGYGINQALISGGFEEHIAAQTLLVYPQNGAIFLSQSVPTEMAPGASYNVTLQFKNTGKTTWDAAHAFRLQSRNTPNNTTWGTSRINLTNGPIPPGGIGIFSATIKAPALGGPKNFQWLPIEDAINAGFGQQSPNVVVNVGSDTSRFVSETPLANIPAGTKFTPHVVMQNTGNTTWTQSAYFLVSQNPTNNVAWGTNRLLIPSYVSVSIGGSGDFFNTCTAPSVPGAYTMQWRMMHNGNLFGDATPLQTITVVPVGDAQFVTQVVPWSVVAGSMFTVKVAMTNIGVTTWTQASGYCLISQDPFNNTVWGTNRLLISSSATVAPEQGTVLSNTLTAPSTPGTYTMRWQMSKDGVTFGPLTPSVSITVTAK